jgi:high-affinity nickel-transport protein
VVVFLIGILAIVAGESLPDSIDSAMGRVVGVTLLILGVYVIYALVRYREDFRMRSRWMLVFASARRAYRWVQARVGSRGTVVEHEHEHVSDDGFPHHSDEDALSDEGRVAVRTRTHTHSHTHTDPFMNYGTGTSLAVGALHGVGAETPTQVLIFLAAAGAGGAKAGLVTLAVFLVGLFAANTLLAFLSASGYLAATRHFAIYATVSVITAVASLVLGVSFVLGRDAWLPVFFGG